VESKEVNMPGIILTEEQARTLATSAMMDALEAERARIGRFGVEYMEEFVKRLEASDPERHGPTVKR
jgi:hypothetical protein